MDKWLAGILATVISGVAVYYLTEGRPGKQVVIEPIPATEPVEPEPTPEPSEPGPSEPGPSEPEPSEPTSQSPNPQSPNPQSPNPLLDPAPSQPGNIPSLNPANAVQPPVAPNSTCAIVPGMFWLSQPNIWYGPFFGYAIAWNGPGGFYVGYYASGQPIFYPDQYASGQAQRNVWLRLPNSPFNICVDSLRGNVFGQYSPI